MPTVEAPQYTRRCSTRGCLSCNIYSCYGHSRRAVVDKSCSRRATLDKTPSTFIYIAAAVDETWCRSLLWQVKFSLPKRHSLSHLYCPDFHNISRKSKKLDQRSIRHAIHLAINLPILLCLVIKDMLK